ncbi:hypothetical protein ACIBLA_03770 [Streptomyces sp. NPDC050433]|uniref:hypothetical protein n=1 Tax=unclassified Streptomyces TaxID=2593676 RepID=UPI00342F86B7
MSWAARRRSWRGWGATTGTTASLVRAVDGCAALLKQDRPAGMVSDLLHKAPEPFGPPAPTADSRFPAWDDRDARPYGHLPSSHLAAGTDDTERRAVDAERTAGDKAREVTSRAVEAAARPSRGQRAIAETGTMLDRALRLAAVAEQEARNAAEAAKTATQARQFCAAITKAAERGQSPCVWPAPPAPNGRTSSPTSPGRRSRPRQKSAAPVRQRRPRAATPGRRPAPARTPNT